MNKMMAGTALFMGITLSAGLAANGSLVKDYLMAGPNELIEYRKEIAEGDTLWNICSEIATNKEDLRKLVWQAMKDNHISDPAELQPGRVVVVRVREARK